MVLVSGGTGENAGRRGEERDRADGDGQDADAGAEWASCCRRRAISCSLSASVIVGCYAYLRRLGGVPLVPSKISLTKLFASLARDRTFYFYEYNSSRKYSITIRM